MADYVLALDQGTTSSRAILFDRQGRPCFTAQREFPQIYPKPGWVEHDPAMILDSQLGAAEEALKKAGVGPDNIAAIGITNQRETTILWERATGRPIHNAVVWQDRRTADLCQRLRAEGHEDSIRAKTGLVIDPYFSASKIAWLLDNVEGARSLAEKGELAFGTIDAWLIWNLTDGQRHVTDRTNAARTLLYNIVEDRWDDDLLKLFGIPESLLPEIAWSSERIGTVSHGALAGIEIAGIAGDQQAALFGQLCVSPGETKSTYGTGCFLLQNIGDKFTLSDERLITTLACSIERKPCYALEGSIFIGGAVVQWLRDNMRFFDASADVEALATTVTSSENLVMVPAFTGLGAPYWDPYAAGMIIGLERGTTIAHIARAALESIAFQVTDVLRAMEADTGYRLKSLRVDGGASANDMLIQFQADLLDIPVERPTIVETTALGAAYLAGLATGFWENIAAIAGVRTDTKIFTPSGDVATTQRQYARWLDAVERSKGWNKERA